MLFPAVNWPLCMAKTFKGNFKEKKRTEKTPLSFMRFPWEISKSKLFEDSSSPERRRGKDRERQVKRVGKKLFLRNSGGRGKRERETDVESPYLLGKRGGGGGGGGPVSYIHCSLLLSFLGLYIIVKVSFSPLPSERSFPRSEEGKWRISGFKRVERVRIKKRDSSNHHCNMRHCSQKYINLPRCHDSHVEDSKGKNKYTIIWLHLCEKTLW